MDVFLYILTHNILPIICIVCLGFLMGKKFPMDVKTLSKLNFYVFVPTFTFYQIYTTVLPDSMLWVLIFALSLLLLNHLLARGIGRVRKYDTGMRNAFMNALMFYNSGNIGVPLITLVFSGVPFIIDGETPYLAPALALQIVVLIVQNLSVNTLGFYNASMGKKMGWKEALISIFTMPTVYAIPVAFLLKYCLPYDLTQFPLWAAVVYLKNGLVPIALFTLGVQLSRTKVAKPSLDVGMAVFLRLIGGPLLRYASDSGVSFRQLHGAGPDDVFRCTDSSEYRSDRNGTGQLSGLCSADGVVCDTPQPLIPDLCCLSLQNHVPYLILGMPCKIYPFTGHFPVNVL